MGYTPICFRFLLVITLFFIGTTATLAQFTINCTPTSPASNATAADGKVEIMLTSTRQSTFNINTSLSIENNGGAVVSSQNITFFPITINFNKLNAGTYTGIISDGENTNTCDFTIGVETCELSVSINPESHNLPCFNELALSTAIPTGGVPPYKYQWTGGSTGQSIMEGNGNWGVTVTDDAGCTATATVQHTSPPKMILNCSSPKAATNTETADGEINVNIEGGMSPYNILITDLNQQIITDLMWNTNAPVTIGNMLPGSYDIVITDDAGCSKNCGVVVNVASCDLQVLLPPIELACHDATTTITPNITGGLPPYTYLWTNNSEEATITVDANSIATVTITDQAGCKKIASRTINKPQKLDVFCSNIQSVSVTGSRDGAVDFAVNGGTSPYTYSINRQGATYTMGNVPNTSPTFTLSIFQEGNYQATIIDAKGCIQSCTFSITEPTCDLSINLSGYQLDCKGDRDGVLNPQVTGGQPPYQYLWGNGQSASSLQNLGSGEYLLSVTDADNCRKTHRVHIAEPDALSITANVTEQGSLTGAPSGKANFTFSGGTPPFNYYLSSNNASIGSGMGASAQFTDLVAGDYTMKVTDANGCMNTEMISIYPCALTVDAQVARPNCIGGSDATIDLTVLGGVGNIIYDWDNDEFDGQSRIENITNGTYRVTVRDIATSCYINQDITVLPSESSPLFIDFDIQEQDNNLGLQTGVVAVTFGGGKAPFTYQFSSNNQTVSAEEGGTVEFSNLTAGTYTFTLIDANQCVTSKQIEILACDLPIEVSVTPVSCQGNNDGKIELSASTSNNNFYYDWANNDFDGKSSIDGLAAGNYSIIITDLSNNCSIEKIISVGTTNVQIDLSCNTITIGDQSIVRYEIGGGTPPYQVHLVGTSISRTYPIAGAFSLPFTTGSSQTLNVTDANGCQSSCQLGGTSSTGGCIDFSAIAFYSESLSTPHLAAVEAIPVGGAFPYSYRWSNGETDRIIYVPYGSELSLEIRDNNNCRKTYDIEVPILEMEEEEQEEEEEEEEEEDTEQPTTYSSSCIDNCKARGQGENFINKIKIGSSVINSGDNEGFRYFPSTFLNFSAGNNYNIKFNAIAKEETANILYWYIWMDLNQDGDFDDSGELLLDESGGYSFGSQITIPDLEHRLTVCTRIAVSSEPITACEDVTNGEVEDYLFMIDNSRFQSNDVKIRSTSPFSKNIAQLFPNPTQLQTWLSLPLEESELLTVDIYNQLGKTMYQEVIQFHPQTLIPLDVSFLANGVYVVQIKTKQSKPQLMKLVVKRSK